MAHVLRPRANLPSPLLIAERLRAEFAHVVADEQEGMENARNLARVIENPPPLFPTTPEQKEAARAQAARLRSLGPGQALAFRVGDDPALVVRFDVIDGEDSIFIGYASGQDEDAQRPLVERCARALDCDVEDT